MATATTYLLPADLRATTLTHLRRLPPGEVATLILALEALQLAPAEALSQSDAPPVAGMGIAGTETP